MSRKDTKIIKAALSVLHYTGLAQLMAPLTGSTGVIFTLHSVRPEPPQDFEPNRILKITPAFLETAIDEAQRQGFDVVSLDEAARRLAEGPGAPRFVCFTFDDGYRDNRDFAYPVFKRRNLPFAIYIPTDFPDGNGDLWWLVLEETVRRASSFELEIDGVTETYSSTTADEKAAAFHRAYWRLRALPEHAMRAKIQDLAKRAGYDSSRLCSDLIMTWDEIRELARDPLVTFGAHTRAHLALAKLSEEDARDEIRGSVARLEAELGRPCRHFSFPYGDETSAGEREFALARDLGLLTAVTTHKAALQPSHAEALTALPRVSLNGDYQTRHFVSLALTGAPFALHDGLKAALKWQPRLSPPRRGAGVAGQSVAGRGVAST